MPLTVHIKLLYISLNGIVKMKYISRFNKIISNLKFIMKKYIFIIFALSFITNNVFSQVRVNGYFDGYWAKWIQPSDLEINGDYDGFIIYQKSEGPWEYRFKFTINNMKFPNKKQRKKDIKADKWYVFTGTVEYYISNSYPSALEAYRKKKGPLLAPAKLNNGKPAKKITSKATIKIAAFEKYPKVYNIWYDKVALAIDLGKSHFPIEPFK